MSAQRVFRATWRLGVVASCIGACGTSRLPDSLRGYEILVESGRDAQGTELARALREAGLRVRREVRGGSRPTAALIFFEYSEPGRGQPNWLQLRLADTRSGVILAAAAIPLDSVGPTPRERAVAAVRALTTSP
jgi:hypothetical protein